MNDKIGFEQYK